MKKKIFHIFHPPAHSLNPHHTSALGLKIKNRKRQPESMIVRSTHTKFQDIWWSHCFWGFNRFEKSSPHIKIQGCLYIFNQELKYNMVEAAPPNTHVSPMVIKTSPSTNFNSLHFTLSLRHISSLFPMYD